MTSTLKKNKEGGKYRYIGRYLTTNRQVKKKKKYSTGCGKTPYVGSEESRKLRINDD